MPSRLVAQKNGTKVRVLDRSENQRTMLVTSIDEAEYYDFDAPSDQSWHIIASTAVLLAVRD